MPNHAGIKYMDERICEATEAMVEQYGTMIEMQRSIITELKKIVQGNAANFDQLRELRILEEKKIKDSKVTYEDTESCDLPEPDPPEWCKNCEKVHSIAKLCDSSKLLLAARRNNQKM